MGRKPKYASDEERAEAKRRANAKYRAKKSGKKAKGGSWLKSVGRKLEAKLDEDSEDAEVEAESPPPSRAGEPFADLPPLDLPGAPGGTAGDASAETTADATTASEPDGSASSASSAKAKSSPTDGSKVFDTEQLQEMASGLAESMTMALATYAAERGYFALGEPFAKLAGISAAVLVKAHATRLEISDEEAAAYVLFGIVGTNGVQAFRARRAEDMKKQESDNAQREQQQRAEAAKRAANGTTVSPADEQRRQQEQRAAVAIVQGAGVV